MVATVPRNPALSSRQACAASPLSPSGAPSSRVVTSQPASPSRRAVIMPSPPLLPRPQSTVTRRACAKYRCAKVATAEEAARISSIEGTPNRSVVARSQACISAAERTGIAYMLQEQSAREIHGRQESAKWSGPFVHSGSPVSADQDTIASAFCGTAEVVPFQNRIDATSSSWLSQPGKANLKCAKNGSLLPESALSHQACLQHGA
jgi:hypothetical protein